MFVKRQIANIFQFFNICNSLHTETHFMTLWPTIKYENGFNRMHLHKSKLTLTKTIPNHDKQ